MRPFSFGNFFGFLEEEKNSGEQWDGNRITIILHIIQMCKVRGIPTLDKSNLTLTFLRRNLFLSLVEAFCNN